ncbi:hypothetical protein OO014_13555 [Intrasporangium calvum]|uniref:Uncharacterized protein n=1 Tax=Intrasporangium calvum TaxID=53358 RepID=A0ABT5GKQ1_9MICO|nr:hypothetical protein [Intrasporangium calvum]MDC5698281.1 hypothetical protein [Intrasporangium calvum]
MTPDEPRLLPDGRVFPPVTPDPPAPPGQEEIVVPDLTFTSTAQPEKQGGDAASGSTSTAGEAGTEAPTEPAANEATPPPAEPSD